MNNDDRNWENKVDWESFDPPAGGREFYDHMKASILDLDAAVGELRAKRDAEAGRVARQSEVMRLAERLQREFDAIAGSEAFQRLLAAMDAKVKLVFPGGEVPTVGEWFRWGGHITKALRDGSLLPDDWRRDAAKAERELAAVENLRRFVALYVSVCESDYRTLFAPVRLRTKMFRETSRNVTALVAAGEALEREHATGGFVATFWNRAKEILEIARKTQKACRQTRKTLERMGDRFWDEQDAARRSEALARVTP